MSLSQQITPTRLRTQVVYEEVYPGVDFQYELYSYHIKETILVKEPLSSGYAFFLPPESPGAHLRSCWRMALSP